RTAKASVPIRRPAAVLVLLLAAIVVAIQSSSFFIGGALTARSLLVLGFQEAVNRLSTARRFGCCQISSLAFSNAWYVHLGLFSASLWWWI
ncbi:hypothetical protein MUK42_36805, partial [Musa troglodytarum]